MAARLKQKARTRQALVDGASQLLEKGMADPSMEEIAAAADVSRATAYRYFDSAADVVWQVLSDRVLTDIDEAMVSAGSDLIARVLAAEDAINGYLFSDPDGARAYERAMLDRSIRGIGTEFDRAARRLRYIDVALEPVVDQLESSDFRRVRHALALAMGSQAVPAMLDTCRLDIADARDATRFVCQTIAEEAVRLADLSPGQAHRSTLDG